MKPDDVATPAKVKQCCANLYESDLAKLLLGDSFHPGGLKLTERLGQLLQLGQQSRVLDVASGPGTSALFLAEHFGCEIIGLDYGRQNIERGNAEAAERGLSARVRFEQADAEAIPFPASVFDAVVCECAFCTFPSKSRAASEFVRVLKPGGRVGISDLTPHGRTSQRIGRTACLDFLHRRRSARCAGLVPQATESHEEALLEMVRQIQAKLLAAEVIKGLKKIDLPGIDFAAANQMAKAALAAVQKRHLGYALITAERQQ
jgi:arsenite methyltransferase